VYYGRYII